ncbi:efflux RND transporter periplasmic adaptor subunit [Lichenibacterium ramalinae]|uniref:Efflux RND transporter periplasmic adaptor subunit n=1 Tax=Lichenibacterium ramalinae TaxID=2316527 RepID=A0A4Q2R8D2_9HYPH|nr:efflux RND transporter periplasmic adaptor subunit [Lichenibacterium ramalinae]RYB02013.1 efflux RND transporter periplasmic adaptor subunit [Lichenibacterium ramalinae]
MRFRNLPLGAVALAVAAALAYRADPTLVDRLPFLHAAGATPAAAQTAPPPFVMPVPVARVVKRTIPVVLDYAARTEAVRGIALQAKVSAYVVEQRVPDGTDVKAGDLLYRLDPRDFQVALDQANAAIERDQASLDYQTASFNRGDALSKSGYLAKDSLDQRSSGLRQAEAALVADRAAQRAAQLNLAYTEIRAPFPGRLGRNQAAIGTLAGAGTTVLNTLVQIDPVYVTFNPGETDLVELQKARRAGTVSVDVSVPGEAVPDHKGELSFVDNSVDRATGTVVARATIANADLSLLPGQYVRVRVHLRDQPDALLVPQVAVGSSQLGKYVMVAGEGDKVEQRPVVLGPSEGALVAVLKGVGESDRVITGNLQKIGPGMPVKPLEEGGAPPS